MKKEIGKIGNFWSNSYIEYESNVDRNKALSIEEYLNKIRSYLKDIINDLKISDTWKIHLAIAINFMSSKDNYKERVIHSKSENIKIKINDKADDAIVEFYQSLLSRCKTGSERSMEGSDFIFYCVIFLYYKCRKMSRIIYWFSWLDIKQKKQQ